jgi:hypothetical protein
VSSLGAPAPRKLTALAFELVGDLLFVPLQLSLPLGNGVRTPVESLPQLRTVPNTGIDYGIGILGLLQELPGLLVEHIDGDMFFFMHLLQLIQVQPLLRCLLLRRHGPCLKHGAPVPKAQLLCPWLVPLSLEHMLHLA